ncbi:TonB-dependent receptor [Alteraurantiacibacter aquimixticola]|uniref:TonB-dependent receptor n=1 Tax=Alteraurantiacibacter aquimixticola TaxID=2489173 RepID=A0A4T3EZ96_9SPHN|nr:TonB-dependent receptor [Alteraurantiacibacter aquimixticola]TIX49464.1 TonB-dependent receptor [Alteraurantiacibacter aquimixticola]
MIRRPLATLLAGTALSCLPAAPLLAQEQDEGAVPHVHDPHDEEDVIVVTAGGLERLDMLAGTSVVTDAQLQRNMAGQVGEVLESLPGVSATGFAPGASRPVLRGFQGERVRVLVDGIGSIDASNTSADHAVTIDPLTAESIEVLRGPAVLLYGSSAIGGAVNVIDRRIPHRIPIDGLRFDGVVSGDTATDLREVGASLDVGLGRNFAWHVDGSFRETDDLEIAGFTLSDELRADLLADAAEEFEEGHEEEADELIEAANLSGIVPNSASETLSLGTGLTWFSGLNSIGVSVSYYDTDYGIPIAPGMGHAHGEEEEDHDEEEHEEEEGHDHGEEPVTIGLEQFRADLRGEFHLGEGFFHDLVTRWGYSDYTHTEFEGDEVGTVFDVEGVEGRVELIQSEQNLGGGTTLRGSLGGQFFYRDFVATGAEAFVPPNSTEQYALFTLQEVRAGPFEAEMGARWENTTQEADTIAVSRSFDTFSGALGLSYSFDSGIRAGVNFSRAERAPSAEELFADGPHIATSQYELGDPDLGTEAAWGVEGYVRASIGGADMRLAVYRNWFDNFIYLFDTGLEEDGLALTQYLQQDADWFGVEGEASVPLFSTGNGVLVGDVGGSYIRATLDDGSPVPRIPPLSLTGALEWQGEKLDLRSEVEWYDAQDRTAPNETATDGFAHVNLSANFRPFGDERLSVLLQADNIFDAEGRRHASYTKDFVPLAGRNFKVSVRTRF